MIGVPLKYILLIAAFMICPCFIFGADLSAHVLPGPDHHHGMHAGFAEDKLQHPQTIKGSLQRFLPESREILGSIMPWNWNSYLPAIALGAVTVPLLYSKDDIQGHMGLGDGEEIRFTESDGFYTHFEFLGDRWPVPAITGAFLLGGLISGSQREVETGLMLTQSLFFTGVVTLTGQFVLSEERPYQGGELNFFKVGGHGISGHSALASLIVGPLDSQYLAIEENDGVTRTTMKYLGKGLLYTSPVFTGVSRVRSNRHYLWNVVLGLATGYSIGALVAEVHEKGREDEKEKSLSWDVNADLQGFCLGFKW